ncbi:MAG: cytochrome c oxidase subunit II [Solirubrobacterales bacterium]|nr:cytochrome c oxidase subunit II [Solirubrobacterales bacterium]
MRSRRSLIWVLALSAIATAVGIVVVLWIDWFPAQASTAATDIDTLYDVLLIVSVPIFVLVMAVALYSVWAFRVKPGDQRDGAPIHGNTRLEIIWVTIPFIIVAVLAGYGWIVLDDIEAKKADELVVEVTGQQFAWSFAYPDLEELETNQLVLPVDRPVHFKVNTKDVLHDFWVPDFRLKTDAVPGLTTTIRVTPNRVGSYPVVCAELCGIGHSTMRQTVRVVPAEEFDAWVERQRASKVDGGVDDAGGDPIAAGRQLFNDTGCNACHTLADAGATGAAGPALDDLAAQAERLGRAEGLTAAEFVETSIVDPDATVAEGYQPGIMPTDYGDRLSPAQLQTLVDYLLEVSGGGSSQ